MQNPRFRDPMKMDMTLRDMDGSRRNSTRRIRIWPPKFCSMPGKGPKVIKTTTTAVVRLQKNL